MPKTELIDGCYRAVAKAMYEDNNTKREEKKKKEKKKKTDGVYIAPPSLASSHPSLSPLPYPT